MLEEAVEVLRALWSGDVVRHRGTHYTVDTARIYSLPEQPVPVLVSGFGPKATELAARIGEGYMNAQPDGELVQLYRDKGGRGPTQVGAKVCWAADRDAAVRTVHSTWAHQAIGGEALQVLTSPQHFEQISAVVTPEQATESIPCGSDVAEFVEKLQPYLDAGFDEVYVSQIGDDQEGFLRFWTEELRDALGQPTA